MSLFVDVCALADLEPERGAGALLGDHQVALFRLADDTVRAVQQLDPYSRANVMSRGLVGTTRVVDDSGEERDVPTVTTPMLKQVWNMETGEVIDSGGKPKYPIAVFATEVRDGRVLVAATPIEVTSGD
ncbi:nitrite reductase (NAD(P)H), small subunit [Xylanimonas cellulosilytica DSM 15894]|uniref:Nitrite reductase (NAD(P)H), small subunit n=1 Tax=Xylanimonas cellulosilytica (strain DSM 15894 / JCM 12276 / CECT 5975 / KCTC 9989 / LMG 20990 / NBRC 107835 / XIL07) TaxID=446471 RepID=D1BSF7_XYLCX|nr:nitrite reductase (NAD(P)H) small subunit [Xylanimonas cellulosilytica]ACZ30649.1 nitrite reductase (NAD(P)H), small subunit [Xylanimonas cellulosilytica DSM 15894]